MFCFSNGAECSENPLPLPAVMSYRIAGIEFTEVPLILAPLEDITDSAFRQVCREMGADLTVTEFISSEGLIRDAFKSFKKLVFDPMERPLAIQVFGHDEEAMVKAARIAEEAAPDMIDINFGCPVKKVVDKGAGAAMLKTPEKMQRITEAVVKAVSLPVTVKTRLGWDEKSLNILDVSLRLQDTGIAALSIHGRTRAQLYGGQADWRLIGEVKNHPGIHIPIIGNGDIDSPLKAAELLAATGVDGLMIGRAAIGNPWIFSQCRAWLSSKTLLPPPSTHERIRVCRRHLYLAIERKGESRAIREMRKHYTQYFKGLPAIKPFRNRLVTTPDLAGAEAILDEIGRLYSSS